jgi:hypothetical protein
MSTFVSYIPLAKQLLFCCIHFHYLIKLETVHFFRLYIEFRLFMYDLTATNFLGNNELCCIVDKV